MNRFKELCMDTARGGHELGRFWAAATGCSYVEPEASGAAGSGPAEPGDVVGEEEGMGIAICPVPEEKTVKHRVHLDVHTDSVQRLLDLGATRAPGFAGDPWTVLLDPEGGELCAFVRDGDLPAYRTLEIVVDAAEPERIARWWGEVLGVEPRHDGQPWWWLEQVPGMPFAMVFNPVPEPKTVKNRIHWDLYGDVVQLLAAGAEKLWEMPRWTVLADPEGNEFCVFPEQ